MGVASDIGKICHNGTSGLVCYCTRSADAGKVVFKARTLDIFVTSSPSDWTCDMYGVTHVITWSVSPVSMNGARASLDVSHGDGTSLSHVVVVAFGPNLEYELEVNGETGCASDQDPDTVCSFVAKYCGDEIYRADGLALHPRSKKFVVKFTTDANADVSGVSVQLADKA